MRNAAAAAGCQTGKLEEEDRGHLIVPDRAPPAAVPDARLRLLKGRARCVLAASGLLAVAAFAALRLTASPCVARGAGDLISLAGADPEDLVNLASTPHSHDAMAAWLEVTTAAGDAAGGRPVLPEVQAAVDRAMRVEDPEEAKRIVERAAGRAGAKWEAQRRDLQGFVSSRRFPPERSPADKASVASCVFDVLQATTQLAAIAAGINDATKTCVNVKDKETLQSWYGKVCSINIDFIVYSVASVASSLAVAANNCAATIAPNLNALCSGSITGLIQALLQVFISGDVTAAGCKPPGHPPPGVTPSNIAQAGTPEVFEHRRLTPEEESAAANATHAHARRLLFGGGEDSTATWCGVDVASAAWYLAQAGLAINAAANPSGGASCPPRSKDGLGFLVKGAGFRRSQGFCAVDIEGAIFGFLQAAWFLSFSAVHCADSLNTKALCSAGVTGILAALDQVAHSGTSMWLACDEFRNKGFPPPPEDPMLKINALGNSGITGRRLEEAAAGVNLLKEQFGSPAEVWRSMGFDLDVPDAAFRKAAPRFPGAESLAGLFEEQAPAQSTSRASSSPSLKESLFGSRQQCN